MSKKIFKVGDKFTNWIIIEPYITSRGSLCLCSLCNKKKIVYRTHLRTGASKQCLNCYKKQMKINPSNTTHGLSKTKEYLIWKAMRLRILNPQGRDKINYKNIKVCDRWNNSFLDFLTDMGNIPKDGTRYSIGRIDNDGDYCPKNCRWETDIQQANNTSRTHWITYNGETMSMKNWSRKLNKSYYVIRSRINNYGWSVEDALIK